jgi:hypothetical protein
MVAGRIAMDEWNGFDPERIDFEGAAIDSRIRAGFSRSTCQHAVCQQ